jgi:hypothetical protein
MSRRGVATLGTGRVPNIIIGNGGGSGEIRKTASSCFDGGIADRELWRRRERFLVHAHADTRADADPDARSDAHAHALRPLSQL